MKKTIELCLYAAILIAAIAFSIFGEKPHPKEIYAPDPSASQSLDRQAGYMEPDRQPLEVY